MRLSIKQIVQLISALPLRSTVTRTLLSGTVLYVRGIIYVKNGTRDRPAILRALKPGEDGGKRRAVALSGASTRFTRRDPSRGASTALIVFAFQLTACATCAREGFVHGKGSPRRVVARKNGP